jgi:HEAT repeat protein
MPTSTDDPLPELLRALRSRTPASRARAAKDLGRLGGLARDALPTLVGALRDSDAKVREAVAQAIGQMGPKALPELATMLSHGDKYVRRNAVWAMSRLGVDAKPALARLCAGLKDADPRTATGAAQALGNMGAAADDAVPALAEAMRGTNIVLCRLAAKALSQIGAPALTTLISHLQHADPFVRGEAALAIGWMGPAAHSAVPFLTQVVRGKQKNTLGDTPSPAANLDRSVFTDPREDDCSITPVNTVVDSSSPEETCRVYAAQALGRMGKVAASAAGDLRIAARTGHDALRQAAQQALCNIQDA